MRLGRLRRSDAARSLQGPGVRVQVLGSLLAVHAISHRRARTRSLAAEQHGDGAACHHPHQLCGPGVVAAESAQQHWQSERRQHGFELAERWSARIGRRDRGTGGGEIGQLVAGDVGMMRVDSSSAIFNPLQTPPSQLLRRFHLTLGFRLKSNSIPSYHRFYCALFSSETLASFILFIHANFLTSRFSSSAESLCCTFIFPDSLWFLRRFPSIFITPFHDFCVC